METEIMNKVMGHNGGGQNKIVTVVVTYNRKEIIRQNLAALLAQEGYRTDIIVVDNDSSDGTFEMVSNEFNDPCIIYRNTGTNLGGAGGFQYGIREAMKNPKGYPYDYVWVMDDDTIPYKDSLKELMMAAKKMKGEWGCLSSIAYWTDGSLCKANKQKKTLFKFIEEKDLKKKLIRVQMASFVSLFIKTSVIYEVGLPIGEYFIWTDDYEYTGRISKKYPLYAVTDSKVIHAMKENKKIHFAIEGCERVERYKYVYRNDVHCYRQYGISGWAYIFFKDLYTSIDVLLHSKGKKIVKIFVIWRGLWEGLHFAPRIEMLDKNIW